ncbi:protein ATP6V1FNB-like [Patiria miniata]|uniref:Sperm microtubule inner protein 1 C-terminal domain-containing protein n=1 Tax=Patiria miniata TaxID=46514 RepID=A0A913ZSE4_PATMI|nr:protein ATP6V1FNB-like [Patiria miniata]
MRELFDVQRQNFWTESIHKEAYTRLAWHEKYSKEFARESRQGIARKHRPNMVPKVAAAVKPPKPAEKSQSLAELAAKKEARKKDLAAIEDPDALLVEMRSVTPVVKDQLYKGFSKEGTGRYAYLQIRKLKKPESKYDFPITSSWEYGWRLDDVVKEFRAPAFGRSRIVKDSFYRTNGIF